MKRLVIKNKIDFYISNYVTSVAPVYTKINIRHGGRRLLMHKYFS